MSKPEQTQRFTEIEYCLQSYFRTHIQPVMQRTRNELNKRQAEEVRDYQLSTGGLLRSFANAMNNIPDDTMTYLRHTGEWNSKTAEDYVEMCRKGISKSQPLQKDLAHLAEEWRKTVVKEIGRQKYDELCGKMGADLAFAYVDYRMEQLMIDKMVSDEMPKSSVEYVLRKGMEGSLLGLGQAMMKSPLQEEIDRRGEAAYNPGNVEKAAGKAVSFGTDVLMTGGFSSWGAIARLAGAEVVFSVAERYLDKPEGKQSLTVEECISRGVFGSKKNVFDDFRKGCLGIKTYENPYILSVNKSLDKKMGILTEKPVWGDLFDWKKPVLQFASLSPASLFPRAESKKPDRTNIPSVVAPGKEAEYLAEVERSRQRQEKERKEQIETPRVSENKEQEHEEKRGKEQPVEDKGQENKRQNENGWAGFLSTFGLENAGDIWHNLGYVIAMLPDLLTGLFTGKTKSLGLKDNMLPIASILIGMFIKNPILKMLVIGMGGMNLLNKAGHEAIGRREGVSPQATQFKRYDDEPLNSRISSPILQGNTLIATIDRVPCSIRLPDNVVAAYQSGALPLNTLANAVLARNDAMNRTASDNYRTAEVIRRNEQTERPTIVR